jgi:hypothetical protein
MWLAFVYFLVTLIICGQAIFNASISVGGVALLGCALCYFATATFAGTYKAWRIQGSGDRNLATIGAIAIALIASRVSHSQPGQPVSSDSLYRAFTGRSSAPSSLHSQRRTNCPLGSVGYQAKAQC